MSESTTSVAAALRSASFWRALAIAVVVEAVANAAVGKYNTSGNRAWMALAVCMFGSLAFTTQSLQRSVSVGMANAFADAASVVAMFVVGAVLFHQRATAQELLFAAVLASGIVWLGVSDTGADAQQ